MDLVLGFDVMSGFQSLVDYVTTLAMVSDITSAFLDTIAALFGGIADGVVNVFETMIYDETDGLTTLGTWMIVFMGFSFAITIFYALFNKVA